MLVRSHSALEGGSIAQYAADNERWGILRYAVQVACLSLQAAVTHHEQAEQYLNGVSFAIRRCWSLCKRLCHMEQTACSARSSPSMVAISYIMYQIRPFLSWPLRGRWLR